MYNWKDLINVLGILVLVIVCLCLPLIIGYIFTHILIWCCNGIFNYDLSDKFWYIFVALVFLLPLLRGTVNVKINK